jgi:Fe-S-cluster containining protein
MLNYDYQTARMVAEKNRDRIVSQMPADLARREDRLFTELSLSKESSLKKLEKLYIFMDELYAFIGKFIPCHKGCNHCCYIEVSISSLEAEYIESNLGIMGNPNFIKKEFFQTPCPFLEHGTCSIYKYRPFVCRRHLALFDNPKWCQLDLCDKYEFPQIMFTEVEKSYRFIVAVSRASSLYDIRQLFSRGQ